MMNTNNLSSTTLTSLECLAHSEYMQVIDKLLMEVTNSKYESYTQSPQVKLIDGSHAQCLYLCLADGIKTTLPTIQNIILHTLKSLNTMSQLQEHNVDIPNIMQLNNAIEDIKQLYLNHP